MAFIPGYISVCAREAYMGEVYHTYICESWEKLARLARYNSSNLNKSIMHACVSYMWWTLGVLRGVDVLHAARALWDGRV